MKEIGKALLLIVLVSFWLFLLFDIWGARPETSEPPPIGQVLDGQTLFELLEEARSLPARRHYYVIKYPEYAYLFTGSFMDYVTEE